MSALTLQIDVLSYSRLGSSNPRCRVRMKDTGQKFSVCLARIELVRTTTADGVLELQWTRS